MNKREAIREELEELGSQLPEPEWVEAPEGYFDRMQEEVLHRIDENGESRNHLNVVKGPLGSVKWFHWLAAAVITAVFFTGLWWITPSPKAPGLAQESSDSMQEEWAYLESHAYELNDELLLELQAAAGETDLFIAVDLPEGETENWLEQEGAYDELIYY